jgi:hypothetical protein
MEKSSVIKTSIKFLCAFFILTQVYAQEKDNIQGQMPSEGEGMFGSMRIGPMIGFGLLAGPNISIEAKIHKYLGLSLGYSQYNNLDMNGLYDFRPFINNDNQDFNVNEIHLSSKQIEAKISYFPFGKTFFVGAAFGKRNMTLNVDGTVNASISTLPSPLAASVGAQFEVSSFYVTPQVGWLASWDGVYGGFAIGTEIGAQIPLSNSVSTTSRVSGVDPSYVSEVENSSQYLSLKNQVQDEVVSKLKKDPLPYWNIIKIGWLF